MKPEAGGSLDIDQRIYAPAEEVAAFIGDFRNAKEWMVGVEAVERLGEDRFRLTLESRSALDTEANVVEHGPHTIRWVYDTTMRAAAGGRRRRLTAASSPTRASST